MNHESILPWALQGNLRAVLSLSAVLLAFAFSAFGDTAAVVSANDGHSTQKGTETVDGFTETVLSGYSANHNITFGTGWDGSRPTEQPQVEPCPPTDFLTSSLYDAAQWDCGSNVLGELHASRLELANMEAALSQIASVSSVSSSGSFSSITVSGTTPWGAPWQGQTVPWTEWDSQNLAGCYQTELWIFGALLMLPIILKVKPV